MGKLHRFYYYSMAITTVSCLFRGNMRICRTVHEKEYSPLVYVVLFQTRDFVPTDTIPSAQLLTESHKLDSLQNKSRCILN